MTPLPAFVFLPLRQNYVWLTLSHIHLSLRHVLDDAISLFLRDYRRHSFTGIGLFYTSSC